MAVDPRAGTLIEPSEALNTTRLVEAFFQNKPHVWVPGQRVSFGTSGHRGCPFDTSFNEDHIAAIVQAICNYRTLHNISGPLFVGRDTHAISEQTFYVALEVLAGNDVVALTDARNSVTPTPAVSRAIIEYNNGRTIGLADGIVITPSHNPPEDGGLKYNPPHGGPAGTEITSWIETLANSFLSNGLTGVHRRPKGRSGGPVTTYDYLGKYIERLPSIVNLEAIRAAGLRIGVDPLGGAAVHYWGHLADDFDLNLVVTDDTIDPTFKTIPRDWDGKIRMDCSSKFPMTRLLAIKERFDIAFANDTDADRHGIVDTNGLMEPNSYLAVCAHYLGRTREGFAAKKIGKTIVSSAIIDRVASALGTHVFEVPVGFKWFVDGPSKGAISFCGEESAGSSYLCRSGAAWTTDKDGLVAGLLAAEMMAVDQQPPSALFANLAVTLGLTYYGRADYPADQAFRDRLGNITSDDVTLTSLAGATIIRKETTASGNGARIGGIKLSTEKGWVAIRPSGTENIYKIYAESFDSQDHLATLQADAQAVVKAL